MIEVRRISEGGALDFEVVVREGEGETRHHVTMSREMCERLMSPLRLWQPLAPVGPRSGLFRSNQLLPAG
jgi:hypothetical protein